MSGPVADIDKARQEHRAHARVESSYALTLGLLLSAVTIILGLSAAKVINVGLQINEVAWIGPALLAIISLIYAAVSYYNSQPIPNEPLHAPAPFTIDSGQPWRTTSKKLPRLLERLKRDLLEKEKTIADLHDTAVKAYAAIPITVSYSDYQTHKVALESSEALKQDHLQELPTLSGRITKIFKGDVRIEILDLEETIAKLQREKQEQNRILADGNAEARTGDAIEQWKRRRERLYQTIHDIDQRIIEHETDLKDLRQFDFQKLWSDLNLPGSPGLSSIQKQHIDDLRQKVTSLNEIPPLSDRKPPSPQQPSQPSAPPPLTAEEQKGRRHAAVEVELQELFRKKKQIEQISNEDERNPKINAIEDAIHRKMEEWSKTL